MKSVFYTSKLIDSYTSLVDAFANPEILKNGNTRMRTVYRSFDKIAKILNAKAYSKKVQLKFFGFDYTEIPAYSSLDLLPFILIDNAIKYSSEEYDVEIHFSKTTDELIVSIANTGCYIRDDEIEKIFKKYVRGASASVFASEGSGIGLYLAKEIARHHNAQINVKSIPVSYQQRGVDIAVNTFSVHFKI